MNLLKELFFGNCIKESVFFVPKHKNLNMTKGRNKGREDMKEKEVRICSWVLKKQKESGRTRRAEKKKRGREKKPTQTKRITVD